jgi:uroporphyrin-III C-methyltransferase/precorrin-2 dehydrogenase/sirohydrochlorin ferrochelatase
VTEARHYLAGLDLTGRRVVVIGGGVLAQRRLPALLAAGAEVRLVSPSLTPTVEGLSGTGGIHWEARDYQPGDLDGAWYALALTDDPQVNARVAADAAAQRTFCVRGDAGAAGSAVTPATGADGPVQVAVLGGGDPGRAVAVRDGMVEALRRGQLDVRARRRSPGVAIVGGGPGDPELITVRGRRLLSAADVVIADRLAPQALLAELAPDVEVIDAAKLPRGRAMAQRAINETMVDRARAGAFVVRLKGGDPYLFGRGSEEVEACLRAGIAVTMVPGVTSALAVPALAGIPLTHRGLAHEAVIVSGHLAPGDPDSLVDWPALARLRGTLLVLMGVDRLPDIARVLLEHGRDSATPVAVVQDGSLPGQRVVTAPLSQIAQTAVREGVRAPAVIVIGAVAGQAGSGQARSGQEGAGAEGAGQVVDSQTEVSGGS